MTTILVLDSSLMPAEKSASRPLTALLLRQLQAAHPGATVVRRDLDAQKLPHASLSLFLPVPAGTAAAEPSISERLVGELLAADIVVIGAPMYNFTVPSTLKAWIDHVTVAGKTFRYTAEGRPEGLVEGKKVFVVSSRGGVYSEGPRAGCDFAVPYLRAILGFLGMTDLTAVTAEGLNMGPEVRAASLARAAQEIEGLFVAA